MGFAAAAIALHEQAGGQQFLEVHKGGRAIRHLSEVDAEGHADSKSVRGQLA